jgi:hypothetical protein
MGVGFIKSHSLTFNKHTKEDTNESKESSSPSNFQGRELIPFNLNKKSLTHFTHSSNTHTLTHSLEHNTVPHSSTNTYH